MKAVVRMVPWAALTLLAILLAGSMPLSQTLWAKVLTISGSVAVASWTATPTETATPTPLLDQGCSPGFWKQEKHFVEWPAPYVPSDLVSERMGTGPLEGNPTMLDALEQGGGGLAAFLRHAVAALLNAAHDGMNYPYSVDNVLVLVSTSFSNGSFEAVKQSFEAANELECPLPAAVASQAPALLGVMTAMATLSPEGSATSTPEPTLTSSPGPETETPTLEAPTAEPPPPEPASDTPEPPAAPTPEP